MLPFILATIGGYLIGSSRKDTYEDGGMMAKGVPSKQELTRSGRIKI